MSYWGKDLLAPNIFFKVWGKLWPHLFMSIGHVVLGKNVVSFGYRPFSLVYIVICTKNVQLYHKNNRRFCNRIQQF